jgi:hypothetical protein
VERLTLALAALLITAPAFAQEPVGCDKFKWPLDHERAMLANAVPSPPDGQISQPLATAYRLTLAPYDSVKLPMPPTRAPKPGTNAGSVNMAAPSKAGTYRITLSEGAWIDVSQNGHEVKSTAFSGATGCDGIRKSVKFELAATTFVVEISGSKMSTISLVLTPD